MNVMPEFVWYFFMAAGLLYLLFVGGLMAAAIFGLVVSSVLLLAVKSFGSVSGCISRRANISHSRQANGDTHELDT